MMFRKNTNETGKVTLYFDFSITGFLLALILIGMFGSVFGLFMSDMQQEYEIGGNNSLSKYNATQDILEATQNIKNSTNIQQEQGILDVIGGYFSAGYSAVKTTMSSFVLFENLMNDAVSDIEELSFFKTFIVAFVMIALFVGVIIALLVKWRT